MIKCGLGLHVHVFGTVRDYLGREAELVQTRYKSKVCEKCALNASKINLGELSPLAIFRDRETKKQKQMDGVPSHKQGRRRAI